MTSMLMCSFCAPPGCALTPTGARAAPISLATPANGECDDEGRLAPPLAWQSEPHNHDLSREGLGGLDHTLERIT
jgi:hypothetical protein